MCRKIVMNSWGALIAVSLILFTLLPPHIGNAVAEQREKKDQVRQINLSYGQKANVFKGTLQPYSKHIYRFRARVGKEMTIKLRFQKKETGRERDLVFWVQSRGWYPPGRSTALLEGIDRGGVMNWSGILPGTGEYEIYVSNPPISDHTIRRSLPYNLEITIK